LDSVEKIDDFWIDLQTFLLNRSRQTVYNFGFLFYESIRNPGLCCLVKTLCRGICAPAAEMLSL